MQKLLTTFLFSIAFLGMNAQDVDVEKLHKKAGKFFDKGFVKEASYNYEEILSAAPNDSLARARYEVCTAIDTGRTAFKNKEYDKARFWLEGLKDIPAAQVYLGQIYFEGMGSVEPHPDYGMRLLESSGMKEAKKITKTYSKMEEQPTAFGGTELIEDGLYALFNTTQGEILLSLEFEKTPVTVANFVGLAEGTQENSARENGKPYYDGLKFHRVIEDFMIQGGDPAGNGTGGPGYSFKDEFHPDLTHSGPGILSMANAGPGTNGSQFFITHKETPWLDNKHSVFGHVVSGQDVVDAIQQGDKINSVKILRKGQAAEDFSAPAVFAEYLKEKEKEELKKAARSQSIEQFEAWVKENYPDAKKMDAGFYYVQTQAPAEGAKSPNTGSNVSVHYTGKFIDGEKFDSSLDRGEPIQFPLGQGRVIDGWDKGIAEMKEGEKGTLLIPYTLGYGDRGFPGAIPPKATLVFDVELVSVQ